MASQSFATCDIRSRVSWSTLQRDTVDDLLAEFPDLEGDDLRACLQYAAQSIKLKSRHLALT
jgi:uncharacterized protein (DUF433 family)